MSHRTVLLVSIVLTLAPILRPAQPVDPVLANGLQACVTNGLQACLEVWYAGRPGHPEMNVEMNAKVCAETKNLGEVFDTEVVAIQTISKRITRYYVAIYFTRRPLWIRIDRYAVRDRSFYLPFKYSLEADEILPGSLTDFVQ
jgi:hypothetical protein